MPLRVPSVDPSHGFSIAKDYANMEARRLHPPTAGGTMSDPKDQMNKAKDKAGDAIDHGKDAAKDTAGDVKDKAGEVKDVAKDKAGDAKDATKDKADDAKHGIEDKADEISNKAGERKKDSES
jgi:hypothetical protein